jgi:hypothetical protein
MSQSHSTFLGRAFARRLNRNLCEATRRYAKRRLRIESLEDRAVPAVFTVTGLGDNGGINPNPGDGTGTLRQAIVDANATPDDDQIVFDPSLFGSPASPQSINLENTLTILPTGGGLTITGPGSDLLTVQRDPAATSDFRVITSLSSDLSLSDFTVSGGTAVAAGVLSTGTTTLDHMAITGNNVNNGVVGGLYVSGGQTVTITNSVISENTATQAGGIQVGSGATVNLTDSVVSGNTASGAFGVGGILVYYGGTLNLERTTISNNQATAGIGGGIIALDGSTVSILDSTISGNTAQIQAGGVGVYAGSNLTIQNSTIANNTAVTGVGGGIFVRKGSTVNIVGSTITGNQAASVGGGAWVANGGTLTIQNSIISGNQTTSTAAGYGYGGGLFLGYYGATPTYFETVKLIDSKVTGNSAFHGAGGMYVGYYASLQVSGSTISGNTTSGSGGGINVRSHNTLLMQSSTVSGNTAAVGAGIYFGNSGSLYMASSTVSDNHATTTTDNKGGAGIYFYGTAYTVNSNFANSLIIVNSTIANNTSDRSGGGILLNTFNGGLALASDTIVGNIAQSTNAGQGGGGIGVFGGTNQIQMVNTIVSGNTGANGPDILSNQTVFTLYSALGTPTGTGFTDTGGAYDLTPGIDLKLGPLADNGGPTRTMAPQPGSPLIDAGDDFYGNVVGPNDQLGSAHVRIFGNHVDIGSYEVQPPTVAVEQAVGQNDPTNGAITFDVKFNVPVTGLVAGQFNITYGGTLDSGGVTLDLEPDPLDASHYTLTISGLTGEGDVTVSLPANVVVDGSQTGNVASTSIDNTVHFDDVPPTVTIATAAGQADPTNGNINFDVKFDEQVSSFDFSNVTFTDGAGLTGVPTGLVTQDLVDPTLYHVTVTGGLNGDGSLTATVDAGATTDLAGNANLAAGGSASVRFDNVVPTANIGLAAGQADPTGGTSASFSLTFSEPIANPGGGAFDGSTITFTGSTAIPSGANFTVQVTPVDSTHYTVTVGGVATGGTIVLNLPVGSFQDIAGNLSTTAVQHSITFHATGTLQFSTNAVSVSEQGGANVTFTVTRTGGTDGTLTVDYGVSGGTASPGRYTFTPGTLTFAPGDTSKTFTVHVNDDQIVEGDQTVILNLSNTTYDDGTGAVALSGILGTPSTETLTIHDFEEGTFQFSSPTYSGTEGSSVDIVVTRTNGSAGPATVDYQIVNGSADKATDIGAPSIAEGTISFADGETSKTITIPPSPSRSLRTG